jgi:hypothetical protein
VVYAKPFTPAEEKRRVAARGRETRRIPVLKRFTVFNTDLHMNKRWLIAIAIPNRPFRLSQFTRSNSRTPGRRQRRRSTIQSAIGL